MKAQLGSRLPRTAWASLWRRFGALLLVLALATTFSRPAQAVGTLIPAPSRVDHIHDTKRNLIYISSQNSILRYSVGTSAFLPPIQLSGSLGGLDLSPDGDTLAVANRTASATTNSIFLFNLATGGSRTVTFPLDFYEGGTWTVAFGADGRLLISSLFNGSGWVPLRRYDPVTGETTKLSDIRQNSMLTASADRSLIGIAESNSSDGPWGSYRVSDGALVDRSGYDNGTSSFNFEIGVNSSGTQFSIPTYRGTYVYNSAYQKVATIGVYAAGQPIGVAYHPTQPKIYFPWAETGEVRVYDAGTFQQTGSFDFQTGFTHTGNGAFGKGRAKVSSDGSLLSVSVADGVRFVALSGPVADSQTVSVTEDSSVGITLSAQNIDPAAPTYYSIVSGPLRGRVTTSPTLPPGSSYKIYTPAPNYYGADSFVFRVTNGNQTSTATVTINVTPVADIPVAQNLSVSTNKNTPANFSLLASDGDNNGLSFEIVSAPTQGKVSFEAVGTDVPGTFSTKASKAGYTPGANYSGPDSFTWRVRDGFYYSNVATTTITVNNNSAPVAQNDSYRTPGGMAITVAAPGVLSNDTDADASAISARLETQTQLGTVALQGDGSFTWTPPAPPPPGSIAPFYQSVSFTYRAVTATGQSAPATVTIIQNRNPVASSQSVGTSEDVPVAITLSANDRDALTYRVIEAPTRGTLSGTAPDLTYTPQTNWSGSDSFTFQASDGQLSSNIATVSISVSPINDAPVAQSQVVHGNEDTPVDFTLSGTDVEGDALTFIINTQPRRGVLSGTAPNLTYTPNPDVFGSDSFSFKVNDGQLDSAPVSILIILRGSSDAPVAIADSFSTNEDEPLTIPTPGVLFNDSDVDRQALSAILVAQPAHGGVILRADGSFTYTPDADWSGTDEFLYKASDGVLESATVKVSIEVKAVNDAPVASAQSVVTTQGSAVAITLTGKDVEGSALTYVMDSQPANGTLSGAIPNLTYTPNPLFFGVDSFSFRVSDGEISSDPAPVSITVHALPVATPLTATTLEDRAVSLALVATASGDASVSAWQIVSAPQNGTLSGEAGARTYTPNSNFHGSDAFTYRVQDSRGAWSAAATVTISVTPVNDAPTFALKTALTTPKNAGLQTVPGWASAISAGPNESGQSVAFTVVSLASFFSVRPAIAPNGTLTFQVTKGRTGTTSVQVQLKDNGDTLDGGRNLSEIKNFSITVK